MDKTMTVTTLGEALRMTLAERHMDQRQAAAEIGAAVSTICRITQGKGFRVELAVPIAKWCGLNPQELWDLLEATE